MPDNLNNTGGPDRNKVSLGERWEVDYWTKKLGCTADELRKAVVKVGTSVEAIQKELKK